MRRAALLLFAVMAVAGCTGAGPNRPAAAVTRTTSPSASAAPTANAAPPSADASPGASPSPVPDLSVTSAGFSCRLPVLITTQTNDGVTMQGGFVTFPEATYQADPNGGIVGRPTGDYATQAQPALYGVPQAGPPFYDLSMKRWLPVGAGQTSPDGSSYAYSVAGTGGSDFARIHLVTVATGVDRVISIGPPPPGDGVGWRVADYDGSFVYLAAEQIDQFPVGVWRLDPSSGSLLKLTQAGHVLLVEKGTVWIGLIDPSDPTPPRPGKGEAFDTIESADLLTGSTTRWVYEPGLSVQLLAVDSLGHPMVTFSPPPDFSAPSILFVPTPGSQVFPVTGPGLDLTAVQSDQDRFWFGSARGLYLWAPSGGLRKLFAFTGDAGLAQSIMAAGHCV